MNTHDELRGLMRQKGVTVRVLAKWIGISETSLTHKLQGKIEFKVKEMCMICVFLEIPFENAHKYFFAYKLKKNFN